MKSSKKYSNHDILAQKLKEKLSKKQNIPLNMARIVKKKPPLKVVEKLPYKHPNSDILKVPGWFDNDNVSEVSIIVPLFKSSEEISAQIRNWDMMDETSHEIIYVSDACPQRSHLSVLNTWEEVKTRFSNVKLDFKKRIGKIIVLSNNSGYANACNSGAKVAQGKWLVFLNADTIPTQNWLKNILLPFDESVGIVGNLQLKMDGSVDSAGSEWSWQSKTFEHIGRNVYQGKKLSKLMTLKTMPEDLKITGERQMVTGCCFAIRKELFEKIGGFDINYRIGYWEDSDICMKVRSEGYKILYEPSSIIYHKGGHSRAGGHPFMHDNARYFYEKWNSELKKFK